MGFLGTPFKWDSKKCPRSEILRGDLDLVFLEGAQKSDVQKRLEEGS